MPGSRRGAARKRKRKRPDHKSHQGDKAGQANCRQKEKYTREHYLRRIAQQHRKNEKSFCKRAKRSFGRQKGGPETRLGPPVCTSGGWAPPDSCGTDYIIGSMPPIPPMPGAMAGLSSGMSATMQSVVRIRPATEAAFCRAVRVTLVGSRTPISTRSPYSPV